MFERFALIAVIAVSALAGCSPKVEAAKALVRERLADPDSAKFRKVRVAENGDVCGEVNAKNRYGGYVGFTGFVVRGRQVATAADEPVAIAYDTPVAPDELYYETDFERCFYPEIADELEAIRKKAATDVEPGLPSASEPLSPEVYAKERASGQEPRP